MYDIDLKNAQLRREEFQESGYPEEFRIRSVQEIMLPTENGYHLRTIVYLPEGKGSFPTLLYRTPYPGIQEEAKAVAEEFCKRGFAYVIQMCRGTCGSEGDWSPNIYEKTDGAAVLQWLYEQKWCKSIGLFGCSYMAYTCWAATASLNDKVRAMYVTHYGSDRYASLYKNGLFKMDLMTGWAKDNAGFPVKAGLLESCAYIPQIEVDEKLWGRRLDWYRDWITHTLKGDEYWHQGFWEELNKAPGKMQIPVYVGAGWFDHHYGGTVTSFLDLSSEAACMSHLRIGAWNHGFRPCLEGYPGGDFQNSDVKSSLDWFVGILREGKIPKRKISLYFIGADIWKDYDEFPVQADYTETLRFTSNRSICSDPVREVNNAEGRIGYIYDPTDPVPSHGAEAMFTTKSEIGSLLQPEPDYRPDVISFVSDPLQKDMVICGQMKVKLYVSSDAEDTAFTSKIMEVKADGKAYNIRSGIATLAFREDEYHRLAYTPGEIVPVTLDNWEIAWKLSKGSRLRVDISSSDFPAYAVHTNYPGIWSIQDKTKAAKQTIYTDDAHPSCIEIPCVYL